MLRLLQLDDRIKFLELLNTFRPVNITMNTEEFTTTYNSVNKTTDTFVYVKDEKIVGTISIINERKFINNGALYAHIEDVVVLPQYQGTGIGTIMMNEIKKICNDNKVYKITLNCSTSLESFYNKHGFINNGYQMVIKTK